MIERSVGIHDGSFHADEVTACALLVVFNLVDRQKIIRTRDVKKLQECEYVCDVGWEYNPDTKRFDHHQAEYQGDLSSAGMVWLYLKEQKVVDAKLYDYLNHTFIEGVDAHDTGRIDSLPGICTFSHVIAQFVPVQYNAPQDVQDEHFFQALDFVIAHLQRVLVRYDYVASCKAKVEQAMQTNGECLFFDEGMPWLESFFELGGINHPAKFVMMPSGTHWKLRGIPPSLEQRMKVRVPLPESWAGLADEELQQVTKIPGAIFCHKGRFISVWETREDALKALELVLNG